MIKTAHDMKVDVRTEFLGGKGTLTNYTFLDKDNAAGTGRQFVKSVLSPGSSIGYHAHNGEFEVYYILSGKALVNDNGTESILTAGDSILTPHGSSHSIENIGDTNLEYISLILFDKTNS